MLICPAMEGTGWKSHMDPLDRRDPKRATWGCCCSSVDSSKPTLYKFIFELLCVEKTKINKKKPGVAHFKK